MKKSWKILIVTLFLVAPVAIVFGTLRSEIGSLLWGVKLLHFDLPRVIGSSDNLPKRCQNRQWTYPGEDLECIYPPPPIGRWAAVYSKEFAIAHNLPLDNVSADLSPGVDYMEVEVLEAPRYHQKINEPKTRNATMVNMLIKRPNDVAFFYFSSEDDTRIETYITDRHLLRLVDIDQNKPNLKRTISFSTASIDYVYNKKGFMQTTFGIYAENVLPSHDYISVRLNHMNLSMHPKYFPDEFAFRVKKASSLGDPELRNIHDDVTETPKENDIKNSYFSINIPHELIIELFKDIPRGGK